MKYTIDTTRVSDEANRMNDIANSITNASDTLNGIIGANALCTDSGRMIMRSLMSVKKELDANAGKTKKYAGALSDIAALYGNAEKKAMGEASHKAKSKNKKNKSNNILRIGSDIAVDLVGGIGPFGAVSGIARDLVFHKDTDSFLEDLAAVPKDVCSTIKTFSENDTASAKWKDLIGAKFDENLTTIKEETDVSKKSKEVINYLKEKALGDYHTFTDNPPSSEDNPLEKVDLNNDSQKSMVKVNWISALLSSTISNVAENGLSFRTAEETGVETLLSVGEDVLVSAAVGAAAAGLAATVGFTAPVILTSLAAVGVGIAFDKTGDFIAQKVTGQPDAAWKECISDKVSDGIEDALGIDGKTITVGSAVQWIGSQLSPICVS